MLKNCVWVLVAILVLPSVLSAQIKRPHLQRLIGIAAEEGVVAMDGNSVSAFSTGNIRLQDVKSLQWRLADKKGGAVTIRVNKGGSDILDTPLSISAAHSFALCDRLNQIDVSSFEHNLRLALPAGARVKEIARISNGSEFVVYSVSGRTVSYDIRVGVVERNSSGAYSLMTDDLVTDSGNFCGVQQGDGDVFFVFADEPSGSSDFSSVYAYSVSGGSPGQ